MINGVLPVDKPAGWTSHDVVARVRRLVGQRQIGHAGTLDPLATGVLLLVLGQATRLSQYLMQSTKVYCAEVVLGVTTSTDDAESPILERTDASHISLEAVEHALAGLRGEIRQVPPRFAAIRQKGEKLYVLARRGEGVEPEPRPVVIYRIDVVRWLPPRVRLRIQCGPGTYMRSLARDIGASLEVGAYLHSLRRVQSGRFVADNCVSLKDLCDAESVQKCILPPEYAVADWPVVVLSDDECAAVRMGQPFQLVGDDGKLVRLYDGSGTLVALARTGSGEAAPFRVFAGEKTNDAGRH
ncbi:MAG TPA: tRNA pseudouridine(55) synthase TruB [Chloroflexota bacterium]